MERDQEWFEKHAKKCNTCGNIPTMVQVTDLFKVNQVLGYKVYCEDCKWEWEMVGKPEFANHQKMLFEHGIEK